MRLFTRIVVSVGLLLVTANVSHAQFGWSPYWSGYAQSTYLQIRTGPNSGFFAFNNFYRVGPAFPQWYYGPVGVVTVPVQQQQPPIIIQNIIQQPAPEPQRDRGLILPPEINPPKINAPAAPKAKAGNVPNLGPAPQPMLDIPDPPRAKLPGRADADALSDQGRKAFANEQYGRALELFRKAREVTPNEPSLYFLMAQTQFALGKYQDAVTSITTGISFRKDWAIARYSPRDLYGKNPKLFDEHVKLLRQTLETFRDDADLRFLLAHQLWFDGEREEAKLLLQKAAQQGSTVAAGFR